MKSVKSHNNEYEFVKRGRRQKENTIDLYTKNYYYYL